MVKPAATSNRAAAIVNRAEQVRVDLGLLQQCFAVNCHLQGIVAEVITAGRNQA